MALLDSEVARIRAELGYNVLSIGAMPYVGITALFEQVIQPYTLAGAKTTSTTTVTAADTPTSVTLTLASATDFTAGDTVVVDVDSRQEKATVLVVSGSTITLRLTLAHSGTYPVTVEGGESIVREILGHLRAFSDAGGRIDTLASRAGIKRVDEIEFQTDAGGGRSSAIKNTLYLQNYWRNQLAHVLGCDNRNDTGGGSRSVDVSVY